MQRKPDGEQSGERSRPNIDDTRSGRPNPERGTGGRKSEHERGYGGEGGEPRNPDRTTRVEDEK